MMGLPDGEKSLSIRLLISTEFTNVTDRQTPHDGIGRAYAYHRMAKTFVTILSFLNTPRR